MGRLKKTESFGIASALLALIMAFTLFSCDTSKTVHHTVTFDLDGGRFTDESQETIQVIHGATIDKPSDPVKDPTASYRYTFAGWYSDEARSIPYSFASAITSDATIYAKWNAHSRVTYRTVTFDLSKINDETDLSITLKDGSEARITVTSGSTVEKPEYSLAFNDIPFSTDNVEWVTEDGDVFDFSNGITADITLYARLTGTLKDSNEAYLAYDAESFLDWMNETTPSDCILVSDIDLEGVTQLPTMSLGNSFDGNGHVIKNLSSHFIFSEIQQGGVVKNLGVVDVAVDHSSSLTSAASFGAITRTNQGRIENCYVTGNSSISTGDVSASAAANVGGICGFNEGKIENCYVTEGSSISASTESGAQAYAGGICGGNNGGKIIGCYVTEGSSISASTESGAQAYAGGICGGNNGGKIAKVEFNGSVYAGILCGVNSNGSIKYCGYQKSSESDVEAIGSGFAGTNIKEANSLNPWADIAKEMNEAISSYIGFEYAVNDDGSTDYPLVLQKEA